MRLAKNRARIYQHCISGLSVKQINKITGIPIRTIDDNIAFLVREKVLMVRGRGVSRRHMRGANFRLYENSCQTVPVGDIINEQDIPHWEKIANRCRVHRWILNVPIISMGHINLVSKTLPPLGNTSRTGFELSISGYGVALCHIMGEKTLKVFMPEIIINTPNIRQSLQCAIDELVEAFRNLKDKYKFSINRDELKTETGQLPEFAFISPLLDDSAIVTPMILSRDETGKPTVWVDRSPSKDEDSSYNAEIETNNINVAENEMKFRTMPGKVMLDIERRISALDYNQSEQLERINSISKAIVKQNELMEKLLGPSTSCPKVPINSDWEVAYG